MFFVGKDGKLSRKRLFTTQEPTVYNLADASPTAVIFLVIKEIEVMPNDTVRVRYLAGDDYSEKETVLK